MEQNHSQLQDLIVSAKSLLTGISINYNSEVGSRTKQLIEFSKQIVPIVKEDYPKIAKILQNATRTIVNRRAIPIGPYGQIAYKDYINAYSFEDLRTAIKVIITDNSKLDELYIELCDYYDLQQDWINFNQRKADFINVVNESVN